MSNTASLKKEYQDRIVPALTKEFGYKTVMQVPVLKKGIESKLDGRGNYTLGIQEQIIFPEINIDNITKILGMNITFVTSAKTDEEGYALLREFGLPFKNGKKD